MTIHLVPFTWARHIVPALHVGGAALIGWWFGLVTVLRAVQAQGQAGATIGWSQQAEGLWVLTWAACFTAVARMAVAGALEGRRSRSAIVVAGGVSWVAAFAGLGMWSWLGGLVQPELASASPALRLRWSAWVWAGEASVIGPLAVLQGRRVVAWARRRFKLTMLKEVPAPPHRGRDELCLHALGGLASGAAGGVVWYLAGALTGDLFLATAAGCFTLGALCGALTWAVPEQRYGGWIRVLRGARPGWRIPVRMGEVALSERFVGHFPSGMDLHLPAHDGVAELHVSVVALPDGSFAVRGLSQSRVELRRDLEWFDLSWDPNLPAPLQAELRAEDRIAVGQGVELEFLRLPVEPR